ncbi:MAG: hypothetical protein KF726_21310 [Anaerolineae bacterium]|nr:hypothetical protein [Anaerolineae bacterium]
MRAINSLVRTIFADSDRAYRHRLIVDLPPWDVVELVLLATREIQKKQKPRAGKNIRWMLDSPSIDDKGDVQVVTFLLQTSSIDTIPTLTISPLTDGRTSIHHQVRLRPFSRNMLAFLTFTHVIVVAFFFPPFSLLGVYVLYRFLKATYLMNEEFRRMVCTYLLHPEQYHEGGVSRAGKSVTMLTEDRRIF